MSVALVFFKLLKRLRYVLTLRTCEFERGCAMREEASNPSALCRERELRVFHGLYALQHRGQEAAGMAVCSPEG